MKKIYNRFFSNGLVLTSIIATLMTVPLLSYGQLYYTVGTGTNVNGQYDYPAPFGNWYDGNREQYLYTAADLHAAGFAAGTITEIAFNVSATNSIATLPSYTVYIQTTTATSLSGWQTITGSFVYQSNLSVSTGWNTLTFNTPFQWNGTDNILIQICHQNPTCYTYTYNASIYYTAVSYNASYGVHNDCTPNMCSNSGSSYLVSYTYRPNIRFTVIPPVKDDAGVAEITSPSIGLCTLGSLPVKVILNNMGSDSMTSCTVHWSVNGSIKTPFSFTGNVAKNGGLSDTVTLGTHTFFDGDTLIVWTTDPNGVTDSFPNNDTIVTGVFEALGGTYTIGGTSPDYPTIKAAVTALMDRGVCSDVTMNIAQGTYNEKVKVGFIPGTSASSAVTFTSDPANTAIVEIKASPDATDNYVVQLKGCSYVTFDNLTLDGSNGSGYNTVVSFDAADYSSVENCIVNGLVSSSTSSTQYTINGVDGMYTGFRNNEVNGGSYSLNWGGGEDVEISGNDFKDAYYYGVYLTGMEEVKFNHNKLNSKSAYPYNYGLYASNIDGASEFIGNTLNWIGYMSAYFYNINGKANAQPIIANNMLHTGNGTYYGYGIYMYNCGYVNLINNTIAQDMTSGGGYYGAYVYGGANKIINNIFYDTNPYTSYYTLYYGGGFAVSESDYNNVWAPNQNFGYLNGVKSTLSAWQAGTGFDMHSTVIDPGYTNMDSMRTCNDSLDGTGTPISYITDDIDGDGRHPVTPDVGADEWVGSAPGSYSAGPDAIVCAGKTATIGLNVTNGTFVWSTNDSTATITVNQAGTYTVTMTSSCGSQHSDTVEVIDQTPVAAFTSTVSFRTGQFKNTSSKGISYMWVVHTTPADTFYSTDLTYVFPDNGPYDVDLYVYNDCDTVMTSDTWVTYLGIQENTLSEMITMMPNPATDVVKIQFGEVDTDISVEVSNIQGQLVYSERYVNVNANSTKTINVSSLMKGMYIVKFTTANEIATKQLIVQ